ncbi:heat shock 70 kDa protein 13-like [Crassostrea angulata]|uniref:heat shock 70 kDa protein 13 n=1 Tax=Magallana gigas TaxID=29159 RepID=UPI0022B12FA3|nr:heat shock 70 kDa protein 13-like [Crassostrea angulata]XP_052706286.1 heat shock 70 kDa protein 13-like [Crassostrea angulata]
MSSSFIILGTSILAVLLAGYFAQKYLPPPKPKIVGIDLGTTFSCVGVYHAVSGAVDILEAQDGHQCIPSVVAVSEEGFLVGYKAVAQSEHNPKNTIYDAKRFIGKKYTAEELTQAQKRYPFKLEADEYGMVRYVFNVNKTELRMSPEEIGSVIVKFLKNVAERNLTAPVTKCVMSVPAEFDEMQRNYTKKAGSIAGLEVWRVINEPTAAALAYGLHTKPELKTVLVVDLGGGTLDVSLLRVQGGMFLTQGMAGNNRLGGQDFNLRLYNYVKDLLETKFNLQITDKEDLQALRLAVEQVKINVTHHDSSTLKLFLHSLGKHSHIKETITRAKFEELNKDLFVKVLDPIRTVLEATHLEKEDIDEIVLVGGSTRIPMIRNLIREFFGKELNTHVDPELAVAMGVSIQAGIIGGMWPLKVSAVELPNRVVKIQVQ